MKWTARALRERFLEFFKEKKHAVIPSASLLPEYDPSVLFTTAGMHPLVPFLLGKPHPLGKRLANTQKCLRTDDIDEVGDAFHHTFFEMLGNWSLGDYFKREAIEWSYEFLTSKKWLALDAARINVSVFAGDETAPRDEESARIWRGLGIPRERIYFLGKEENWWGPAGQTGPCGPDTEIFYDSLKPKCGAECRPGCNCGKYFEIWNDVFLEYNKKADGSYEKLKQRNVDTGMGLERTLAALQGKENDYETEIFAPTMREIEKLAEKQDERAKRIIADHLRAAAFVLAEDGRVIPSNVERGYVLRKLVRRAIRFGKQIGIQQNFCSHLARLFVEAQGSDWPELARNQEFIYAELDKEEERFSKTLAKGLKAFARIYGEKKTVLAEDAFLLFQSFGFPLEMTLELAREKGLHVDVKEFEREFARHQELSRQATAKKFGSGLADHSEKTVALHTATHLLHAALRAVLGPYVRQHGSNITPERLRFDFTHPQKMSEQEIKRVEELVNEQIRKGIPVERKEETLAEARAEGALAFFDERYAGQKVSVYSIGGFSKEVCTGPHAANTRELGRFKIIKEEGVSAGVRRIKAVLEKG